jgi:hypothetical protein
VTPKHYTTTEQPLTQTDRSYNWRFVLLWIAATTFPILMGFPILRLISRANTVPGIWRTIVLVLPFFTQWLVLMPSITRIRWWPILSIIGLVLGGMAASVVRVWFRIESPITLALLQGLCVGVLSGLFQAMMLRRGVAAAVIWFVVSILAWASAFTITWWDGFSVWISDPLLRLAVTGTVMGLAYSIPTGLLLAWLSTHPPENLSA